MGRSNSGSLVLIWILQLACVQGTIITGCSALGMARGDILDKDITASSQLNSDSSAFHARLGNTKAWIPSSNDRHPWIQVNLQYRKNITAIVTQGFNGSSVKSYYVSYGDDGSSWMNYTVKGKIKIWDGNAADTSYNTEVFHPTVLAQHVRLHPTNCPNQCALRLELYACNITTGLPGKPPKPTAKSVSTHVISISWTEPSDTGAGITGYNVQWHIVGKSRKYLKVITGNRTAKLDVIPYTEYDIQVRAYNGKGDGPWSQPLRKWSAESVPSAAPGNFRVTSTSSLSLDVSWDAIPEEKQQGKLLGYHVYYKIKGSAVEQNETVSTQLALKLQDLEFATYAVRVAGYTAVGVGNSTAVQEKKPKEGAPTKPRNLKLTVTSSKSIRASWLVPLKLNGILIRYVVMYGTASSKLDRRHYTGNTVTTYSISGLEEFTEYFVQVYAETSVSGNPSNIEQAKTHEDSPSSSPVIDAKETKAEDAHTIRVKWNEINEKDQNGIIKGYTVYYNEKGKHEEFTKNTTATSTIIKGLNPYTEYCIKVTGFTHVGESPQGSCFDVKTLESGPSHPQNVKVQAMSSVSIRVTWDEPAIPNGVIKDYIISYGTNKDVQQEERKVTGNTMERVLDGLHKFTTYFIKVRGNTTKIGNASKILNATTHEDSPGPPREFNGEDMPDMGTVYLSWKDPKDSNGILRFYYIRIYDTKTGQQVKNLVNKTAVKQNLPQSQVISNLKPFTNYTFTIQAVTIKPGNMANFTARTDEGVPSQPRDVTAELVKDVIVVTWREPQDHNGILTRYKVFCDGTRDYNSSFKTSLEVVVGVSARSLDILKADLKPGTKYSVYVKATTVKGDGAESDPDVLYTPSKAPPPPLPPRVAEDDVTPTTITISLTPSSDRNGKIIAHQVIVEIVGKVSKREANCVPDDIFGYKEAQTNGDRFYIAAQFNRGELPAEFILGDGKIYGGYENTPLEPESRYKVYLRGITEHNGKWLLGHPAAIWLPPTDPTRTIIVLNDGEQAQVKDNSSLVVIILASSTAVLFVTLLIFAGVFIFWRRKQRKDTGHVAVNRNNDPDGSSLNPNNAARQLAFVDGADTANNEHREECGYAMLNPRTMTVPGDNCYASIENESDKRISTNEPSKTAAIPLLRRSLDDEEPRYVNQTPFSDYENI